VVGLCQRKNVFSNVNISGHRQDIKVLWTVIIAALLYFIEKVNQLIIFKTLSSAFIKLRLSFGGNFLEKNYLPLTI
jgi:hypothetical protein